MFSSYPIPGVASNGFSLVTGAFLQSAGLPFAEVLPAEEIAAAFAKENVSFAQQDDDIYTPAVTLWAWLSQVVQAGVARSCVAAVSRVISLCIALGRQPPSPDSGAYCRARAKLPERVLERLVCSAAESLESRLPADWLWHGRHVKIADGTTLLAPDTKANQRVWPQARTQKPGVGFPLLRMLTLVSLATGALGGVAIGPYKGKETGEPALLRELLDRFQTGDVMLGDCCFASYFMLALLSACGVDVVMRQHQRRRTDFRCGQRLGTNVRARWHVELDLRSAKVHLHLDDLRCLSPEMLRREILVHWLAYNLVRKVMAQAALTQERLPRQLSFAAALAVVVGNWLQASLARQDLLRALAQAQWRLIAWQRVGDRPDRVEPRAIKRRPKSHKLLTKPRQQARADLLHSRGVKC